MKLRLATKNDLELLKSMYNEIIENMYENNIKIWNEYYPNEVFSEDIENNELYVLEKDNEILAACALCDSNGGESCLKWQEETKNVLYIDRLGVNTNYLRQGVAGSLIKEVKNLAKERSIKYLRLFVVDVNIPAINLYLKNGFKQVAGVYEEKINENYTLSEFGFEMEIH